MLLPDVIQSSGLNCEEQLNSLQSFSSIIEVKRNILLNITPNLYLKNADTIGLSLIF
jgi:hypothetical protein